jgi:hypothetical protein
MTDNAEHRLDVLERQVTTLRQQVRDLQEWIDTISSHPVKRVWWFLCGWRLWSEGRWYGRKYKR